MQFKEEIKAGDIVHSVEMLRSLQVERRFAE